jgi:HSP20 family protein
MSTEIKKGKPFPTLISDFFENGKLFSPVIHDLENRLLDFGLNSKIPSVNIKENGADFKIELAAPGLEKKDFKIEVENGQLVISAEKEEEKKEENEKYRRREFSYNFFKRSFDLPENSVPEKIEAKYENGLLKLTLPKKEAAPATPKKEIAVS